MNLFTKIILFAFLISLLSCRTNKVSYYKAKNALPKTHNKIMVVSILNDTILGNTIENYFINDLNNLGYNTTTAIAEFGRGSSGKLNDEQSYIKLNKKGIDALLIIVLLDEKYKAGVDASRLINDPGIFYYQRISDYYKKKAAQSSAMNDSNGYAKLFMESVFFDLNTLEPLFSINTKLFLKSSASASAKENSRMIINKMIKLKVLKKHKKPAPVQYKPI